MLAWGVARFSPPLLLLLLSSSTIPPPPPGPRRCLLLFRSLVGKVEVGVEVGVAGEVEVTIEEGAEVEGEEVGVVEAEVEVARVDKVAYLPRPPLLMEALALGVLDRFRHTLSPPLLDPLRRYL